MTSPRPKRKNIRFTNSQGQRKESNGHSTPEVDSPGSNQTEVAPKSRKRPLIETENERGAAGYSEVTEELGVKAKKLKRYADEQVAAKETSKKVREKAIECMEWIFSELDENRARGYALEKENQSLESKNQSLLEQCKEIDQEEARISRSDQVEHLPDPHIDQIFRDVVYKVRDIVDHYLDRRKKLREYKPTDLRQDFPGRDLALKIRGWRHDDATAEKCGLEAWIWLSFIAELEGKAWPCLWAGAEGQAYHKYTRDMEGESREVLSLSLFTNIRSAYAIELNESCKDNDESEDLRKISTNISRNLDRISTCKGDLTDQVDVMMHEALRALRDFQRTTATLRPYYKIVGPQVWSVSKPEGNQGVRTRNQSNRNASSAISRDNEEKKDDGEVIGESATTWNIEYTSKLTKTGRNDGRGFDETSVICEPQVYAFTEGKGQDAKK